MRQQTQANSLCYYKERRIACLSTMYHTNFEIEVQQTCYKQLQRQCHKMQLLVHMLQLQQLHKVAHLPGINICKKYGSHLAQYIVHRSLVASTCVPLEGDGLHLLLQ